MRLGTAVWTEGPTERRALVTPLADGRYADLNRIERVRLAKLGEGEPEALAEALVPPSLRRLLAAGPRGFARLKQTLAYAEKWARRGDLPDLLALPPARARLLACLPRPSALRQAGGEHLDRLRVLGPGAWLAAAPEVSLAAVGQAGGDAAGFCLALHAEGQAVLGAWLLVGEPFGGDLLLRAGTHKRHAALEVYEGLELPPLRPAEVLLLPPLRLRALPTLDPGADLEIRTAFDALPVNLGPEALHGTVQ